MMSRPALDKVRTTQGSWAGPPSSLIETDAVLAAHIGMASKYADTTGV